MTSPTRHNYHHAVQNQNHQNRPAAPIQPNFMPANELQAAPAMQPPPHFVHQPLPVVQYPGLPQNAIEHTNAAHNNRHRQHNIRRQQDRQEIRQQVQAELMVGQIQPPSIPHIPDQPVQPAPPMPPVYGPIHYEGAVGPHNFNDPLRHLAHNPTQPIPVPPGPDDHDQFNQQQEAEHLHRDAQNDLAAFYVLQQQAAQGHNIQQQLAEMIARHAENARHEQQQEAKWRNRLHQGPQNFDEPPHDYVPNPVPPRNNMAHIQQQLHQQEARRINREAERVINREAEEALHQQQQQAWQQQMQQQMQQQEALQVNRQSQHALEQQQEEEEQHNRQDLDCLQAAHQQEEQHDRQDQDHLQAAYQQEELHNRQTQDHL
ncbi:hypothetical protein BDR04DRAFT_1121772 [Suillus decipiens]|nr:hypothetical protein BDR04DRAFT_1121772 [Suillus decipiens]